MKAPISKRMKDILREKRNIEKKIQFENFLKKINNYVTNRKQNNQGQ